MLSPGIIFFLVATAGSRMMISLTYVWIQYNTHKISAHISKHAHEKKVDFNFDRNIYTTKLYSSIQDVLLISISIEA